MNPKDRVLKQISILESSRHELFSLYSQATIEKNKSAVLSAQLNVMIAMSKLKNLLGIPLTDSEKKGVKTNYAV